MCTRTRASRAYTHGRKNACPSRVSYLIGKILSIPVTESQLLHADIWSSNVRRQDDGYLTLLGHESDFGPVAELLLIRHTVNLKKKCIIVLPFVSIVTEKSTCFRKLLADEKVEIGCFHSGAPTVETWDIAICTIEKVTPSSQESLFIKGQLLSQ